MNKTKRIPKHKRLLTNLTYSSVIVGAVLYQGFAGELRLALISALLGTAGAAWGWASK